MRIKHVFFPLIALMAVAAPLSVAGWLATDNEAWAQPALPAPANVQVVPGDSPGEVVVSWDPVADASGYAVGWLDHDSAWDAHYAGQDWRNLVVSVDVAGSMTTTHAVMLSNPTTDMANYHFRVGAKTSLDAEPEGWSAWQPLSVRRDTTPDVRAVAAAHRISRLASELVARSGPTRFGMTPAELSKSAAAVADHKAALDAQLEILSETGRAEPADRIAGLVDDLVSNSEMIQLQRPPLLDEIVAGVTDRQLLTRTATTMLLPAAETSADNQFHQLITGAMDGESADLDALSTDDILQFAHVTSLLGYLGPAANVLAAAADLRVPSLAGRVQEMYETAAIPVERDIQYLEENGGPEFEELIQLSHELLAVATGDDNIFDRLERRLSLAAAENALIAKNNKTLDELLSEIDALTDDVPGVSQPSTVPGKAAGEPGVTDDEIRFGQSAALLGPAAALGEGMQLGILAAFKEANDNGGVHGRQLTLKTLNDDYETVFAFANTQLLISKGRVFGLIGAVGTPTSRAALPLADAQGVPFVGAFTGAQLLRGPDQDNVLNVRASYHDETEHLVQHLERAGKTRVAVVYQNDSFALDGLAGVQRALDDRGMALAASWYYPRNTRAVQEAAYRIAGAEPGAVIIIGAHAPAAELIRQLRRTLTNDPVFMAVSFVGSNALKDELVKLDEPTSDVYVTQVVPLPTDESDQLVAAYRDALSAHDADAEPGFVSLEGYLAGRLAIARLEACGAEVTRDCFLNVFDQSTDIDIDGFRLQYGPGDNQGSDDVFLTQVGSNGEYQLTSAN